MVERGQRDADRFRRARGARATEASQKRTRRLPSIDVNDEELARIHRLAAERHQAIAAFVRDAALSVEGRETNEDRKGQIAELRAHRRLFYQASNNLNQIARATNSTGEWQQETKSVIDAMMRYATRIDEDLERLRRS